jgi:phosphoenolpyruvate carboxylase
VVAKVDTLSKQIELLSGNLMRADEGREMFKKIAELDKKSEKFSLDTQSDINDMQTQVDEVDTHLATIRKGLFAPHRVVISVEKPLPVEWTHSTGVTSGMMSLGNKEKKKK